MPATSFFSDMLQNITDRGRKLLFADSRAQADAGKVDFETLCEMLMSSRGEASGMAIAAEILDRRNRTVAGFSREECLAFTGDAVRHVLKWKTGRLPAEGERADYKLRFWLKSAELFSYLPRGLDPSQPDLARFPARGP